FARLGLVIIDEEQRFGVEHKEYLKRLRTEVDVLGMSATPIPRTLEMGVAGIREMSTILTPPEERHPVLTFVGAYDEKQVAAAIRRELLRDGQVFFVHNRVASIGKAGARVAQLVPEARVAIAHGRMNGEAVSELRGSGPPARQEVRVELPVNAHIPHEYVPGERLRLEAYTRIAAIESDDGATAVRDELTDRYGPPPVPVLNLLE